MATKLTNARVERIMRETGKKEGIPRVSADAVVSMNKAATDFIRSVCAVAAGLAKKDRRKTTLPRDIDQAVKQA